MKRSYQLATVLGGDPLPNRDKLLGLWDENGISYIGKSIGPVQPGRGYTGPGTIVITGLTTDHTITADSTDVPTCSVDGTLTIADGDVVCGFHTSLDGVEDGYFPCAEGSGFTAFNTISDGLPHGVISDDSIHTELNDGTGFDTNINGFSLCNVGAY